MWSKMDDGIPDHPKFVAAGSDANWLWFCGVLYANRQLTDGFIPEKKVRTLGSVTHPLKAAKTLVRVGLWEKVPGGYKVHDFHDFNPQAADVKAKRERDRVRKESERNPHGLPAPSARTPDASRARDPNPNPNPNPKVQQAQERDPGVQPVKPSNGNGNGNGHASLSPKPTTTTEDPFLNQTLTLRAGDFIRAYIELYPKCLNGARYVENSRGDYDSAVKLCQTWDDRRLLKLAKIFLMTDHKFAEEGSRTITQFKALASWCDTRLSAVEAGKA